MLVFVYTGVNLEWYDQSSSPVGLYTTSYAKKGEREVWISSLWESDLNSTTMFITLLALCWRKMTSSSITIIVLSLFHWEKCEWSCICSIRGKRDSEIKASHRGKVSLMLPILYVPPKEEDVEDSQVVGSSSLKVLEIMRTARLSRFCGRCDCRGPL